jgi:hypothetical protein
MKGAVECNEFRTAIKNRDWKRFRELKRILEEDLNIKIFLMFESTQPRIKIGNSPNKGHVWSSVFDVTTQVARQSLEIGVRVKVDVLNITSDALQARKQLRQATICILDAKRCRSRRIASSAGFANVLQIIARCMWNARLTEDFWFK